MNKHLALIVDDEPDICELLELTLNRMDIETVSAGDLKSAYKLLNEHNISICLTDMRLPDGNGIELVKKIQEQAHHIPVAMISAHGNMDTAIEALKAGAFDFVSKPLELAELRNLVNSAIKLAQKSQQTNTPGNQQTLSLNSNETEKKQMLQGHSSAMQDTRKLIEKLAKSQAPVYISGESGTGKELAANQIHNMSSRSDNPFVPVNCGAIPSELVESEFFGHIKGSFTGANKDKQGLFQAAHGGTLFLDEVADLPLSMQVKLLRAIQEKAIRPVGAQKEEKIDVRIISATHKNLKQLVTDGDFRQDLYYRINVIELPMPPLRKRAEDITLLAEFFLEKLAFDNKHFILSDAARQTLIDYSFPGNVRELENILERAITLCDDSEIQTHDLSLQEIHYQASDRYELSNSREPSNSHEPGNSREPSNNHEPGNSHEPDNSREPSNSHEQINSIESTDSFSSPPSHEQQIRQALEETRWNRKAAANLLGITYRQFRYKLKKLGID